MLGRPADVGNDMSSRQEKYITPAFLYSISHHNTHIGFSKHYKRNTVTSNLLYPLFLTSVTQLLKLAIIQATVTMQVSAILFLAIQATGVFSGSYAGNRGVAPDLSNSSIPPPGTAWASSSDKFVCDVGFPYFALPNLTRHACTPAHFIHVLQHNPSGSHCTHPVPRYTYEGNY